MGGIDLEMPGRPMGGTGVDTIGYEGEAGGVEQVDYSYQGGLGEFAPPVPIATTGVGPIGVPAPQIVAETGHAAPGMPSNLPVWGIPNVGTPIGLPGPPHLPYGGPASLQSHTMRNLTKNDLPDPVEHSLTDVKHTPGFRLPAPVSYTYYEENPPGLRGGRGEVPRPHGPPGRPAAPGPAAARRHAGRAVLRPRGRRPAGPRGRRRPPRRRRDDRPELPERFLPGRPLQLQVTRPEMN